MKEIEEVYKTTNLVSENLALGIVLEMTITFETAFNEFPELLSKGVVVEEVVNTETRTRSLSRVRRTNPLLGGTNANQLLRN